MNTKMTPLKAAVEAWFNQRAGELCTFEQRQSDAIRAFMDALPKNDAKLATRWIYEEDINGVSRWTAFVAGREALRREIEEALKGD